MSEKRDSLEQFICDELKNEAEDIKREVDRANMPAMPADLKAKIKAQLDQQIEEYERAYNNAEDEDEKETIFIEDYVDEEFLPYIEASEPFRSIVVSKSQAPCGYLLFDGDIEAEIGLVCVKSKNSKKASLCTVIDGYTADAFGYVKND